MHSTGDSVYTTISEFTFEVLLRILNLWPKLVEIVKLLTPGSQLCINQAAKTCKK